MPDEFTSGAKHITSLDFDITQVPSQFDQLEQIVQTRSRDLKNLLDEALKVQLGRGGPLETMSKELEKAQRQMVGGIKDLTKEAPQLDITVSKKSYEQLQQLRDSLRNTLQLKGEAAKIDLFTDGSDGLIKARVASIDREGNKIVETFRLVTEKTKEATEGTRSYTQRWKLTSSTITQNLAAQAKAQEQLSNSVSKIKEQLAGIEGGMKGRLNIGANKVINEQLANYKEQVRLIEEKIKNSEKLTDTDLENLDTLKKQTAELKNAATVTKNSGINKLVDRTMWRAAFKIEQSVLGVIREMPRAYKEVEMALVEITRVMNEATLDTNKYMNNLYQTAVNYGREMDTVTEVTLRFAQAGYNSADAMKLTETTMLALNTAELEVETATNSLIGIMQQWGFTANEYEGIIDRINITADNYAITSQDLVAALLQSSSVAKTAGINFEDLIGILTTMKVASGQSGKAVGTAARSILTLMQRVESLKGFEDLGIDIYADKATGKLLPMMDILQNMAEVWNKISDSNNRALEESFMSVADAAGLMSEEIAEGAGVYDEYVEYQSKFTEATNAANDAVHRQQAQLAANTMRRNYYIALMENFANVQDVVNNMQSAEGYSMRENAKYMDTLEAKYTSFTTAVQQLAVSLMDSGLADIAKVLLDATTRIIEFANKTKLTLPIVTALGAYILNAVNNYSALKARSIAAGERQTLFGNASLFARGALDGLNLKMAAMTFGRTLLVSAIIRLVRKIKEESDLMNASQEIYDERVKAIKEERAAEKGRLDLADRLVEKLKSNMDAEGKLTLKQNEASDIVKRLNESVEGLNLVYNANTGELNMNTDAIERNIRKRREQIKEQGERDELEAKYEKLAGLYGQQADLEAKMDEAGTSFWGDTRYFQWSRDLEQTKEDIKALETEIDNYENYLDKKYDTNIVDENTGANIRTAADAFAEYAEGAEAAQQALNDFWKEMQNLQDVYTQLASGQALSAEQVFELVDSYPELGSAIRQTADGWYVEESAMRQAIQAKYDMAAANQAQVLAQRITESGAYNESAEMENLANKLYGAKTAAERGAVAMRILNSEFAKSGQASDGVITAAQKLKILAQMIGSVRSGDPAKIFGGSSTRTGSGGTRSIYQGRIDELERLKKSIQETAQTEIDALKRVQEAQDRYREMRDLEEDLERAQTRSGREAREDERDLLREIEEKKEDWAIEDQIAAIERQRDAQVAAIDAEINALREKTTSYISGAGEYAFEETTAVTDAMARDYEALLNGMIERTGQAASAAAAAWDANFKPTAIYPLASPGNYLSSVITPSRAFPFPWESRLDSLLNPSASNINNSRTSNIVINNYGGSPTTAQQARNAFRKENSRFP